MKIDWIEAKKDYLSEPKISYSDIAKKYGVSKQSICKRAKKEKWQELKKKVLMKVDQKLPEKVGETLAEVKAKHIRLSRILQSRGWEFIVKDNQKPRHFDDARKSIESGVRMERSAYGLDRENPPTINIQAIIQNWVEGKGLKRIDED